MTEATERLSTALADRYRIERRLGEGGMATVYLAEDLKHDRKVALKVLRPELAAVIGAERFVQEIKTTASLQHPHILPLYDSGRADEFLFYVMPYIEGETLRDKLNRETQLGIDEAVRITTEVADALQYAHTQGVIHRDIKPENILLHAGRPMVADFGIALALSAAAGGRMTETGMSLGTPHYMSPEQATAEKDLTNRSDIYSLGSVLYEMLTGEPPHVGNSAQAIILKIVTEDAAPVTKLRKSVPANVAAAVTKALERLPADRFESAKAFADALANPAFATVGTVGTAGPAGTATRSAVPPFRRSAATLALALTTLVALALTAWALLRPRATPLPTHLRVALTSHPIPLSMVGRDLALSPDGRTIVFSDTAGGTRQLWIKTPDRAEATILSGTVGARAPTFSPDGEWIAFVAEGKVRKVARSGGSAVTVADSADVDQVPSVAWLEGGVLVYTDPQYGVRVVPEDGGPARSFSYYSTQSMGVVSTDALPGGRTALIGLCSANCPSSLVGVVNLQTGALDTLTENAVRGWHLNDGRIVFVRLDGGVFVAPYDASHRRLATAPVPVLDGVQTGATEGDIALAPNGTLLYVTGPAFGGGAAPADVVWVTRQGVVTPVDTSWTILPAGNGGIRLSPDGRRLALAVMVSGSQDIWIRDLNRGTFTRLTFEGVNTRPEWSPDGRYILYDHQSDLSSPASIWRRRADGTGNAEKVLDLERPVWEIQQPRDTSLLVVRFALSPSRDIYLYHRGAGTGDTSLVPIAANNRFEETSIALSPDDRWIAYASNETGPYEIYVQPLPGTGSGRWQVSRDGGNEPRWAHSGRELFYRRGDGYLVAVTVPPGPTFSPGDQHALFQANRFAVNGAYSEYDISPDDRRFVFKRPQAQTNSAELANTVVLVQHWLTELDQRSGGH